MKIRPYSHNDKDDVVLLLELNTPEYFDLAEKNDFEKYLNEGVEDYFVIEYKGKIVGAGGINYIKHESTARFSWDMINPNLQGLGYGRELILHRIKHINTQCEINKIEVRTSQYAYRFYEKMNFKLVKIEKDYWAEGYDLYLMELHNVPCRIHN